MLVGLHALLGRQQRLRSVIFLRSASSLLDRLAAGRRHLARGGQLKESVKLLGGVDAHDELLQFLALILADHIAAERGEFHRDFILGHGIARIAFGNIDTRGMRLAVVRRDRYATRLKLRKERFELFVRDYFHFVHDWNERLVQHALFFELQRRHHPIDQSRRPCNRAANDRPFLLSPADTCADRPGCRRRARSLPL